MTTSPGQPERKRVWKTHKRREEWDECPECGQSLKWLYMDAYWIPCNHEPVMFILHPDGKSAVIYKKELYEKAIIYKKGDTRFNDTQTLQGYIQHFYDCPVLRRERYEWARKHNSI